MQSILQDSGFENITKIVVNLSTKFKKLNISQFDNDIDKGALDDDDITKSLEKTFHNAVFQVIEDFIMEYDDEFEYKIKDKLYDLFEYGSLDKIDNFDFSDFGRVAITICKEKDYTDARREE
jgi:hypothetical protein